MAKTAGNSKLFDVWAGTGNKVEPELSKKNTGWLLQEQPPYEYMNWIQNLFSMKLNYLLRSGIPEWDADNEYLAGDVVKVGSDMYIALAPNTNNQPPHSSWRKTVAMQDEASILNGMPPVGSIMAYIPGYFSNSSNGGFTSGIASNTIAAANALLNPKGWYVCDGAALNLLAALYYNGEGRCLPNLTDDRFLMGDTLCGGTGGTNSNNIAHTHTVAAHTHTTGNFTLTTSHIPSHNHSVTVNSGGNHRHGVYTEPAAGSVQQYTLKASNPGEAVGYTHYAGEHSHTATCGSVGGGSTHNHGSTGSAGSGNTGSAGSSSLENRPRYLSCLYIVRVF